MSCAARGQQMTVLRLENCGISDASGVAIATMLASGNCAHLVELALPHNALGIASAAALGDLLRMNETLQRLDLAWNLLQVRLPRLLSSSLLLCFARRYIFTAQVQLKYRCHDLGAFCRQTELLRLPRACWSTTRCSSCRWPGTGCTRKAATTLPLSSAATPAYRQAHHTEKMNSPLFREERLICNTSDAALLGKVRRASNARKHDEVPEVPKVALAVRDTFSLPMTSCQGSIIRGLPRGEHVAWQT